MLSFLFLNNFTLNKDKAIDFWTIKVDEIYTSLFFINFKGFAGRGRMGEN